MDERALGRAQGFLMAYDLIKWVLISLEFPSSKFELQTIFRGLKTEATFEDTIPPPPTPEELEEKAKIRQAQFEVKCKEDPEYLKKCLEHQKKYRPTEEEMEMIRQKIRNSDWKPVNLSAALNMAWNE